MPDRVWSPACGSPRRGAHSLWPPRVIALAILQVSRCVSTLTLRSVHSLTAAKPLPCLNRSALSALGTAAIAQAPRAGLRPGIDVSLASSHAHLVRSGISHVLHRRCTHAALEHGDEGTGVLITEIERSRSHALSTFQ